MMSFSQLRVRMACLYSHHRDFNSLTLPDQAAQGAYCLLLDRLDAYVESLFRLGLYRCARHN
jgi:hypothetical protein